MNIFKYVNSPMNLDLTCQNLSVIVKNPYELLIICYGGKAHILFHAIIRFPTFINISVCQNLIAGNVMISRYFIQRLLMHFGKYDQRLTDLKIDYDEYDVEHDNSSRIRILQQFPWEGCEQLCNVNEESTESLFFESKSHILKHVPFGMLRRNLKDFDNWTLNKRFSPFPPRTKALQINLNNSPSVGSASALVNARIQRPGVLRQRSYLK
jgi:hypothetical protein